MFGKKKQNEELDELKQLKGLKWQSILMGLLFVLVGMVLILNPESVARTICFTVGSIIMIVGIIDIIVYFLTDFKNNMQQNKLVLGILLLVVGIFFIAGYKIIVSIIPLVMGILILFNGVMKLQTALNAAKMKSNGWGYLLGIAIVVIILGAVIIFNPFGTAAMVLRVAGVCLVFSGVMDIINMVYMSRKMSDYIKDMEALNQDIDD